MSRPRYRLEPGDLAKVAAGLPFVLRTVVGLSVLAVGANVLGAAVIATLVVVLNTGLSHHQLNELLNTSLAVVIVSAIGGTIVGGLLQRRTLKWLLRDRMPDRQDARRALRMPLDMALIAGITWAIDAIVIASVGVGIGLDASTVAGMASGTVLAGLCSAGLTYLLVARIAQPVTTTALAVHPPGITPVLKVRTRLLLIWALTTGIPVLGIIMILTAPSDRSHVRGTAITTACLTLGVGVIATALAARAIGAPLRSAVDVLRRVGDGDLDTAVVVEDAGEIGLLQSGINDMVTGLRERDRVRDLFGRHVGPAVADEAVRSGITMSGELLEVVALFVDITGSTALTRTTEPGEFVAMLNRYFEVVVEEVEANGGLLNKFEGDAALCVFGAPVVLIDPATSALRAARAIRDRVRAIGEVEIGIGVAAGPVVAGQIGTRRRLEYTIIGDAVNEAARLTDLAKGVSGNVLASGIVTGRASRVELEHWSDAGDVILRGRNDPTRIWTA